MRHKFYLRLAIDKAKKLVISGVLSSVLKRLTLCDLVPRKLSKLIVEIRQLHISFQARRQFYLVLPHNKTLSLLSITCFKLTCVLKTLSVWLIKAVVKLIWVCIGTLINIDFDQRIPERVRKVLASATAVAPLFVSWPCARHPSKEAGSLRRDTPRVEFHRSHSLYVHQLQIIAKMQIVIVSYQIVECFRVDACDPFLNTTYTQVCSYVF